MSSLGEALIDWSYPIVIIGQRQRGIAIIVGHRMASDNYTGTPLCAFSYIVNITIRGQAIAGLKMCRVTSVHDAVF